MNDLFAKHSHSTELIQTVLKDWKGSGSTEAALTSVTKTNKSAHKHNMNNENKYALTHT